MLKSILVFPIWIKISILGEDEDALDILAGTRLTLKTGVKTLRGRISFLPQSLPGKIITTYLIRVFDTTRGSKFWVLKFLFLGQFYIFSY